MPHHTLTLTRRSRSVHSAPAPVATPLQQFLAPLLSGGAYWGYYASGNSLSGYQTIESGSTRTNDRFDILKYYTSTTATLVPATFVTAAHDNHILHVSFPWRATGGNGASINGNLPAPDSSNKSLGQPYNEVYRYTQMTSGAADTYLTALAAWWVANLGDLPFVTWDFMHEPEATRASAGAAASGSAQIRMGAFSDPDWYFSGGVSVSTYTDHKWTVLQEYVAAAQYIVNFLRSHGVTNLLDICTHASFTRPDWQHQALYNPTADMFGWDPYNASTPSVQWSAGYNRLEGGIFVTYDPAVTYGGLGGTTLDAGAMSKPYMVQEWGGSASSALSDSAYATYINNVITALSSHPKIKGCSLFGSGPSALTGPLATDAFQTKAADPYVNKRT